MSTNNEGLAILHSLSIRLFQDARAAEEAAAFGVELLGHVRVALADVARGTVHRRRPVEQGNIQI